MTFPYGLHLGHLLGTAWARNLTEPLQAMASGAWAAMLTDGASDGGRTASGTAPAGAKASAIADISPVTDPPC
jgi:hypothetical protein